MHSLHMPRGNPMISDVIYGSCGAHVLNPVAAFGEYGKNMLNNGHVAFQHSYMGCWKVLLD